MDVSRIPDVTSIREDSDWEFKSARGGLPASLWETYSAMANTDGGTIVLGAEDDGTISGLNNPAKMQSDFWSTINNRGKVSLNLLTDQNARIVETDGQSVLVIEVPRAGRRQKPIYINQNPLGGWRKDRDSSKEGLTIAGLLMFGKDEAIRDPAAVPQYHIDYREKLSDDPDVRWTDRLTIDGTWVGNLFQFYQRVIVKLTTDLKIPFQLQPNLFRKDDTIVHRSNP